MLIENCTFDTGDDCIAIKSGRNADGRKWNIPSENIIVRNVHHVYNISVEDSHFNNVAKAGNDIKGAKDVTFRNLYINGKVVK